MKKLLVTGCICFAMIGMAVPVYAHGHHSGNSRYCFNTCYADADHDGICDYYCDDNGDGVCDHCYSWQTSYVSYGCHGRGRHHR